MPSTSTHRPKRSSSCGRSSPSSGFMVPTRMNRDGCDTETPSRSTVLMPHRRGVEQHVDDVIVEQVHLVDVQDVAVRLREHTGLELPAHPA